MSRSRSIILIILFRNAEPVREIREVIQFCFLHLFKMVKI